jgi:hypothetical protein
VNSTVVVVVVAAAAAAVVVSLCHRNHDMTIQRKMCWLPFYESESLTLFHFFTFTFIHTLFSHER